MASLWDRFWEGLYKGIEDARDDIRHKVLEEGWFGRQVTDTARSQEHEGWLGKENPDDGLTNVERLYKLYPNDPDLWGDPTPVNSEAMLDIPKRSFDELWATEDRAKGVEPPEKDRGIDI